ncbi:AAA family ATPase [Candidatus Daviesbacteria bacterium]|nr:AAA family ATPase [Candidatus Daviesbacteria bacterium]
MDNSAQGSINQLKQKIDSSQIPEDVKEKLSNLLRFPGDGPQFQKLVAFVEFIVSLPFGKVVEDILDLNRARQILDKEHYGLKVVKDRVLEYLSVMILHKRNNTMAGFHAPILAFVGLVGTGKTSIAYSIAESLGRPIVRIPFGGLGDPLQLRGQSRVKSDAEPGQIIKAIRSARVDNPVILLDEIDRVMEDARADIMGVLVELLDPAQNQAFVDHYLDFPYDLSKVMFIATANNTGNIATAVLDRLEPIQMPSYSDEEKQIIGQRYLLPKILQETGMDTSKIVIEDLVWPTIIRPLGFDAGIRSLSRTLQTIARKVAVKIVEGQQGPFTVTTQNIGEYLGS